MNIKKIAFTGLLMTANTIHTGDRLQGISFFSPRSQSTNAARDNAGIQRYTHLFEQDTTYGFVNFTTAYNRSLRPRRTAEALFGVDTLVVSGSLVPNRCPQEILADYFGLSQTFNSVVKLDPHIQSLIVSCDGYVGLENLARGLYFEFHIPTGWTQWNMELKEQVLNAGTATPFVPNYMDVNAVTAPIASFKDAFKGNVVFGQMQDPLKFGKINGAQSTGGIADVQCALGWDFLLRPHGHVGFNVRLVAPTGTRPDSKYFFEPILGNGKHWELGIGFNGRVLLWEKDGEQTVTFNGIANVMHLFRADQCRSFDFKKNDLLIYECPLNGKKTACVKMPLFGSRFILFKEFDGNGNYTGSLTPAINQTTLPCRVSVDIEVDVVALFEYTYNQFTGDIGYNIYLRSREKVDISKALPEHRFAFKGIQNVTAFNNPINTTQSTATLFGNQFDTQALVANNPSPVFVKNCDLDPRSAASPRILTQKLFANLGYTWMCKPMTPFVNLGAELEFEGINTRDTRQPIRNTLAQWGIWFKAGCTFS